MVRTLFSTLLLVAASGALLAEESDYYRLETYEIPADLKLEASGLALFPDG